MRWPLPLVLTGLILLGAPGCRMLRQHEGPSAYVGDSEISARVEIALIRDRKVDASEIEVHTYQGEVTLYGTVDSAAMAQRAERITRDTPGVRAVDSRLQVPKADPKAAGSGG